MPIGRKWFAGLLPGGCNANHCAGRFHADAKTGTLTFAPGETTKTITIEVKGDSKKEPDETFCLEL